MSTLPSLKDRKHKVKHNSHYEYMDSPDLVNPNTSIKRVVKNESIPADLVKTPRIRPIPDMLINNPNITLTPTGPTYRSKQKKLSQNYTHGAQTLPISVFPIVKSNYRRQQVYQGQPKEKPSQKRFKRPSTNPISNKVKKMERNSNNIKVENQNNQILFPKGPSSSSSSASSKSYSTNRDSQASSIPQPTEKDLNFVLESTSDGEQAMILNTGVCMSLKTYDLSDEQFEYAPYIRYRMYEEVSRIVQEVHQNAKNKSTTQPILPSKSNRTPGNLHLPDMLINNQHITITPTRPTPDQKSEHK